MKRLLALISIFTLLLAGCSQVPATVQPKQYTATFLDLFDTVTTILGKDSSEEAFRANAQAIHDQLLFYHQLFDIYNDYEGVVNLKTVNDQAGKQPVTVDAAIIALLKDCKSYYDRTDGKVNVAMGSVLQLWHVARNDGIRDPMHAQLPDAAALAEAANHTSFDSIVINEQACTVFITDPQLRLDVGAIAKGWAAQKVAENTPKGILISVGGNVCAPGPKADGSAWVVGVQDPNNPNENLHALYLHSGAVVTSGDYQRTYMVDGKQYHHIIDPVTQMPAAYWRSVTVVCPDSGLADALSTGLFLMDLEDGKVLAQACGADVLWIDGNGNEYMTAGFEAILRN